METATALPDDDFDEKDNDAEMVIYGVEVYKALSPCVKQFLLDYFGELFYRLESETYREVEIIIREKIETFAESIPDQLYRYRTITDFDLYEEAWDNFKGNNASIIWPKESQWYDRPIPADDDDEFMEGISKSELTDEQKLAKKVIHSVDKLQNYHNRFANFMKEGCHVFIPAIQSYIEKTASFELSVLSPVGFKNLQSHLEMIADFLFDPLFGLLDDQE